jgi:hypothetical protein
MERPICWWASTADPLEGVAVFLGEGNNLFAPQTNIDLVAFPKSMAFGDVNGGGLPDIVGCRLNGDIGIAHRTSGRTGGLPFASAQHYWVGAACFQVFGGEINATVGPGIVALNVNEVQGHSGLQTGTQILSQAIVLDPVPTDLPQRRNQFLPGRRGFGTSLSQTPNEAGPPSLNQKAEPARQRQVSPE